MNTEEIILTLIRSGALVTGAYLLGKAIELASDLLINWIKKLITELTATKAEVELLSAKFQSVINQLGDVGRLRHDLDNVIKEIEKLKAHVNKSS